MATMGPGGGSEVGNGRTAEHDGPSAATADALGDFAADLGKFLGGVQSRATSWLDQRKAIAEQLTQIRDTANKYLEQLTGPSVTTPSMLAKEVARRGRPPGSKNARPAGSAEAPAPASAMGRRTMSAAARKRISDAQKARWAKQRGR